MNADLAAIDAPAPAQTTATNDLPPLLHLVPHLSWPVALCGHRVKSFVPDTRGRDRCAECLRLSVGRRFDPSTPPPNAPEAA